MSRDLRLETIFSRCDQQGNGFIGPEEFRQLCSEFDISSDDSDIIFADLDHDGDGKIDFEDFSFGFRDFLVPGSRRGSIQLSLVPPRGGLQRGYTMEVVDEEKQKSMEERHRKAQNAWQSFADNMGKDNTRKFLSKSGDKILSIFEELRGSNAPPHLVEGFEDALSSLLKDVRTIETEQQQMEDQFNRERENHSAHLASIEAELDIQVAKVEAAVREKAKQDFEAEKRALQEKMETEILELQSHLRLFQKVDTWINKEEETDHQAKERLDNATQENRELKQMVSETQTNIAILKSEMSQLKNQYESRVEELTSEKENMLEYVYQYDNLQRQLQLLHDANKKLQDTNDSMMNMVDLPALRSPRIDSRREHTSLNSISCGEVDPMYLSDGCFGITRLLDDIDSGISTMPGEDDAEESNRGFTSPETEGDESAASYTPESAKFSPHIDQIQASPFQIDRGTRKSSKKIPSLYIPPRPTVPPLCGLGRLSREVSVDYPAYNYSRGGENIREFQSFSGNLEPTGPPDRTYKVVFAGDAAVGKTSFINRITKGVFLSNLSSTLGVDFQVKTIRVDDRNIAIQLWDTAGQERFRSVTKTYFRRADGVMLLYDVTSDRSFAAVRHWIQNIDEVSEKRIPIILCGNKVDQRESALADKRRCVTREEGEVMAREYSAIFFETSSKDGMNIADSLVLLAREMCSNEDVEVQTSALKLREIETKSNCCAPKRRISVHR